jgi:nitrite reductase/ring-hydroxylating ferredoxin subunit
VKFKSFVVIFISLVDIFQLGVKSGFDSLFVYSIFNLRINMYKKIPLKPYPNGWYVLASSRDVKKGQIVPVRLAGRELIIFRTETGAIAVSDAYCPHMGGHFGFGGTVVGESVKCPFHHFCFDTQGDCTATGYGTKPSPKLKLPVWHSLERNGFILAYYDEMGKAPEWEVPEIDQTGWNETLTEDYLLDSHPQETTENSVDLGHFSIVHGYSNVKQLKDLTTQGHYLNTRYTMTRRGGLLSSKGTLTTEFEVHVYGLGYSFVEVDIPMYGMRTRQFVLPTPVGDGKINLKIGMSVRQIDRPARLHPLLSMVPRRLLNRIVSRQAFRGYAHDVRQDFAIWQNKIYIDPPVLAKGDGPVAQYRLWSQQFYYAG